MTRSSVLALALAFSACRVPCQSDLDCDLGERCSVSFGLCAAAQRPAFESLTGDSPTVVLTSPLPDEVTQNVLTPVSAYLARPVDPRSVNGVNFVVEGEGGARPAGDVAVSIAPPEVVFVPRAPFIPGRYTATLPAETRDALSGRARSDPYRWSFTIAAPRH